MGDPGGEDVLQVGCSGNFCVVPDFLVQARGELKENVLRTLDTA